MFGGFGSLVQLGQPSGGAPGGVSVSVGPAGGGFGGGFPGIYPAAGPGQSGFAGIRDIWRRQHGYPPTSPVVAWGEPVHFLR